MKSRELFELLSFKIRAFRGYFFYYFRFLTYKLPKYIFHKIRGKTFIHFIHIPKTGGTAIKNALRGSLNNDNSIIILHPHLIKLSHIPYGDKVFFFVRDPAARFVSAFNMRKSMLEVDGSKNFPISEIEIFDKFANANDLAEALTLPIEGHRKMALSAFKSMFFVKEGLGDWLVSEQCLLQRIDSILFIGRQENMQKDFSELKVLLHLDEGISLPTDPLVANKSIGLFPIELSAVAKRNLREIYCRDYEILLVCEKIRDQIKLNIDKDSHEKHKNT